MKAWQLLDEVLERGDQKAIAYGLHVSKVLVSEWTAPPEEEGGHGRRSPLETTSRIVHILRENGNAAGADAIGRWFNESIGWLGFPAGALGAPELAQLGDLLKEVSDVMREVGQAMAGDGQIDLEERRRILRELRDVGPVLMAAIARFEAEIADEDQRLRVVR